MIKRVTELANAFGTDEIMFVFKFGSMPMAAAEKSMRVFAKEVMPALKELRPAPLTVNGHAQNLWRRNTTRLNRTVPLDSQGIQRHPYELVPQTERYGREMVPHFS